MALTDNSDLYGAIHEEGINRVAQHIMRQRPSLFNYGTALVAATPELLCEKIDPAPAVIQKANPLITVEDPLPVLGTNGAVAVDFCFQLTEAQVDFHPGNVITLPPELSPPLGAQHFAINARVCGGLGCPSRDIVDAIPPPPPPEEEGKERPPTKDWERNISPSNPVSAAVLVAPPEILPPTVLPTKELRCFCLDLFVVGHIEVTGPVGNEELLGKVDGLEIVDIKPDGLENSLECYLNLLLQLVILPRVSFAIPKMIFNILNLATITLSASTTVPNNPAIEDDQLKVFIDLGVSP